MDLFKQGMKGPIRQAPPVPGFSVNRYSPVTNWNDDPFGADVFEPTPQVAKKKPPPRPPPPKVNKQPDIPAKPSHFMRKPTVLTSLLSRKSKNTVTSTVSLVNTNSNPLMDGNSEVDATKMFHKCEPKNVQNVQMGALIDLSSPPSSPTFTTRSSSDGLSVDSFSSDATTSTNHHNAFNNGNASQAESGFEDDFELFMHSRKKINKEDTLDDFTSIDPFSPPPASNKPPLLKKPILSKDLFEVSSNVNASVPPARGPTIIRAKPARPKPPDNSALLKSTFSNLSITSMNVNTTTPIQKINNGFGDSFESKLFWEHEASPEREASPPMPSVPPPPPPAEADAEAEEEAWDEAPEDEKPCAIALFDYFTDHPDDLCFSVNSKITLIRRVDDEWLYGRARSGAEGVFPASYVEVKVPLPGEAAGGPNAPAGGPTATVGGPTATATALYDFRPDQPGDLPFYAGDTITLLSKLNEEWYYGECNGSKGQFPYNYVQIDS